MAKKCYRCGSERLTRLVPAGALVVPERSEAVADRFLKIIVCKEQVRYNVFDSEEALSLFTQ